MMAEERLEELRDEFMVTLNKLVGLNKRLSKAYQYFTKIKGKQYADNLFMDLKVFTVSTLMILQELDGSLEKIIIEEDKNV